MDPSGGRLNDMQSCSEATLSCHASVRQWWFHVRGVCIVLAMGSMKVTAVVLCIIYHQKHAEFQPNHLLGTCQPALRTPT